MSPAFIGVDVTLTGAFGAGPDFFRMGDGGRGNLVPLRGVSVDVGFAFWCVFAL